ncbi:MAG: hypothetical protein JWR65_3585 [Massilia sp.]|jgi:uncharacterized protein (TIGR02001 family)|nr:hypothetical protein [Massilia sp.]
MLAADAARGQASASLSMASEYSVRGVSLSSGRPAPQLSLAYDAAQGWYAGAFAAPGLTLGRRAGVTQLIAYGGYARRLAPGLSWEAGASSTSFRHAAEYNYRELYAGLAFDRVEGRVYLAPAYYGYGGRAAYGELNGFYPLREHLKLIAHIGALHAQAATARGRIDLRLAIGYDSRDCNVQLAWLASNGRDTRAPRALSLSVTHSF